MVTFDLTVTFGRKWMRKSLLVSVAIAAALNFCASAVFAGPIEDRQEAMKANGQTMKILGGMAQGDAPFDAAVVKEQGEAMAARFDSVRNLFPPGTEKGPPETYAKAEVWSDPQGFVAALDQAMNASLALAAVTEEAQLEDAIGNVGGACKNCHDKYRRPKE
jgi:cytochrome c556